MAAMMQTMSQVLANGLSQAFQNLQNQNNPSSSNSSFRPPRLESDYDGDPKNQPPNEWLQKAEMQFRAHNSPESRWVVSAVPFLSGLAFTWYLNNFQNTENEHNWAALKAGLQQAYIGADPQVRGMQIITSVSLQKSEYNVAQYIARFQKAATEMGSEAPTEKFQCYLFHNGLDLELKTATACKPQTGQAFETIDALIKTTQSSQQAKAQGQTSTQKQN